MSSHERSLESIDASVFLGQDAQPLALLKSAYAGDLISSLSSPVVHDLSQPVVAIRFFAELLVQKLEGHPDPQLIKIANNILNLAQTSTESLASLRSFLSYREGEFRSGNLSDLMLALLPVIRIDCKRFGIDLDANISPDLMIFGDFQQLRLALHALTRFLISRLSSSLGSKSLFVNLHPKAGQAHLWLGAGDQSTIESLGVESCNIVLDSALQDPDSDQDLGLFLSKQIFKQHHANLSAKLDPNNSPIFKVVFPSV